MSPVAASSSCAPVGEELGLGLGLVLVLGLGVGLGWSRDGHYQILRDTQARAHLGSGSGLGLGFTVGSGLGSGFTFGLSRRQLQSLQLMQPAPSRAVKHLWVRK